MEWKFYKKGQIFGRLAQTQVEGGGRYWSGAHAHMWDTNMLYGNNPTWMLDWLRNNNIVYVTLGWHASYGNLYGPGTNFPQGHPGIDIYTSNNYLVAPVDMWVYETWVDPAGGNNMDTSNLVCKTSNSGLFGFEHCRIVDKKGVEEMDVVFTGKLPYYGKDEKQKGTTDDGWKARITKSKFKPGWWSVEFGHDHGYMKPEDMNSDLCWEDK